MSQNHPRYLFRFWRYSVHDWIVLKVNVCLFVFHTFDLVLSGVIRFDTLCTFSLNLCISPDGHVGIPPPTEKGQDTHMKNCEQRSPNPQMSWIVMEPSGQPGKLIVNWPSCIIRTKVAAMATSNCSAGPMRMASSQ